MSGSTIGIKIANGSYFPIVEEDDRVRKKLVLTTVNDSQKSVQIDLYRGVGKTLDDASYLGSLIIENIQPANRGEPEIELLLGIDSRGNLNASASDMQTGERQSLSVSLEALSADSMYEVPDFELDESYEPELSSDYSSFGEEYDAQFPTSQERFNEEEFVEQKEKKLHPLLLVGFILLGLAIIGLIGFLIFRSLEGSSVPPLKSESGEKTEQIADAGDVEQPESQPNGSAPEVSDQAQVQKPADSRQKGEESKTPVGTSETDTEAAQKKTPEAGVEKETPSRVETPSEQPSREVQRDTGVWYTIKWGDTLWDISASFYRTPWLFGLLARVNNIDDPNLIFAGKKLYIPER